MRAVSDRLGGYGERDLDVGIGTGGRDLLGKVSTEYGDCSTDIAGESGSAGGEGESGADVPCSPGGDRDMSASCDVRAVET